MAQEASVSLMNARRSLNFACLWFVYVSDLDELCIISAVYLPFGYLILPLASLTSKTSSRSYLGSVFCRPYPELVCQLNPLVCLR